MKQMLEALQSLLQQFYLITLCTILISNRLHVHLGGYTYGPLNCISLLPSRWPSYCRGSIETEMNGFLCPHNQSTLLEGVLSVRYWGPNRNEGDTDLSLQEFTV